MERNEISLHEVKIYRVLSTQPTRWFTVMDLVKETETVARRTVTEHVRRLVGLGLLDRAEVFPAHRYQWAAKGDKRNEAYTLRLKKAQAAFGLE